MERTGFLTASDGSRLFWRAIGFGTDPLVVLHGGPGFHMNYLVEDLRPLATARQLLFYDQRGAGQSDAPHDRGMSAADFVDDLETLRTTFELERLRILGHSWGGLLAGLYAVAHPLRVERLVLFGADPPSRLPLWPTVDPVERLPDEERQRLAVAKRRWMAGADGACRDFWRTLLPAYFGDRSHIDRMRGDICDGPPDMAARLTAAAAVRASLGDWDLVGALQNVAAPTLIIHGSADPDPLEGAKSWAAALPNARLVILDGVGHFPHVERPTLFFAEVDEFLTAK